MTDDYGYHRRHGYYYYDDDDLFGGWGAMLLLLLLAVALAAASVCLYSPGCGGCCYGAPEQQPRRVVRYEIVRQRDRDGEEARV
jgi:hypothetical protein